MDSPSTQRRMHVRLHEDDEINNSLASVESSFRPLHRFLCVLVVSVVLAALVFSSLPLWSPVGSLMLHKLWDVLRFLVLTTSIGVGILNSGLWRGTCSGSESAASSSGKEDSFSSKVPFAGMFYGEVQHSYSFSDKETGASEYGPMNRSESDTRDAGHSTDAMVSSDQGYATTSKTGHDGTSATFRAGHYRNDVSVRALDDNQSAHTRKAGIALERDGIQAKDVHHRQEESEGAANHDAPQNQATDMCRNSENVVSRGKSRVIKPCDDIGIADVAQQPKQNRNSKIIHRRGNSLELPNVQESGASVFDSCAAINHLSTPQASCLLSKKAASCTGIEKLAPGNRMGNESSNRGPVARHVEHPNMSGRVPGAASGHSRSQSAYNLDELLVQQRPRRKPSTAGQLSRRRNVSLSCDLDKEYTNRGMPAWLSSVPSPPAPPFISGYDSVKNEVRAADTADGKLQDEISLKKAFTESLVPWRALPNAVPVNIPTHTRTEATQSNKHPSSIKRVERQTENIPACPSTKTMGSPSPRELNKKVDAFIARFHERMRLQRLESLERAKQKEHH